MNKQPKTARQVHIEVANTYQSLFNHLSKEHGLTLTISEMDDIIKECSKINLSREQECLREIVGCTRQSGNGRNRLNDNKLGKFHIVIEQAKQLLNK